MKMFVVISREYRIIVVFMRIISRKSSVNEDFVESSEGLPTCVGPNFVMLWMGGMMNAMLLSDRVGETLHFAE